MIEVVAGVLGDARGRVLLAQRAGGRHSAGLWEFPGGKLEFGESPAQALRRELKEELAVEVETAEALLEVPWDYPDKRILLRVWRVTAWRGEPQALEHRALAWIAAAEFDPDHMSPADRPVLALLRREAEAAQKPGLPSPASSR